MKNIGYVQQDSFIFALEFADPVLKRDREIVLEAVKKNGFALKFADPDL